MFRRHRDPGRPAGPTADPPTRAQRKAPTVGDLIEVKANRWRQRDLNGEHGIGTDTLNNFDELVVLFTDGRRLRLPADRVQRRGGGRRVS